MNHVTIEWVNEEEAYIVRQNGEYISDYADLLPAAEFAIDVATQAGTYVELIAVNPNA